MKYEEIVQKFIDKQSYLTNGAGFLSKHWNVSKEIIKVAKKEARKKINYSQNDWLKSAKDGDYLEWNNELGKLVPKSNILEPAINTLIGDDINRSKPLLGKFPKQEPLNEPLFNFGNTTEPKGKLLKRWGKEGSWQESYSFDGVESLDIDKILNNINLDIQPIQIEKIIVKNGFILNVYLSDQHIGAKVENGLYSNYFDSDVYWTRMDKVFIDIVAKAQLYGNFEQINIFFLGDTFDGQDGYTVKRTHQLPQNMSNNEAFELGLDVNLKFIDKVVTSGITNKVEVYCVSDSNHGGSMDYYLFKSLQKVIKYKYPELNFVIANKFIDSVTFGEHTFLYTHGKDGKDMKFGLPLDLNDKTENFINDYINNYEITSKNIHTIKGDLHQDTLSTGKRFSYRNVPSLFGSSGWIMKNFGNTKPGVGYDIFNPNSDDIMRGTFKFK